MKDILDAAMKEEIHHHSLIKIKHILILFLIGWIMYQIGALFKIMSWEYDSQLLTLGTFVKVLSALIGIIKLVSIKEVRSFLNR